MLDRIAQIFRGDERLAIAIELVVIWAVLFVALRFLRGTRGAGVLKGVIAILAAIILSLRFAGSGSESFARLRFIAEALAGIEALAISPRVASALQALAWRRIRVAGRPDQDHLLELLNP